MPLIGKLTSRAFSTEARTKRACSEVLDGNDNTDVVAIMHTTTAITITHIDCYGIVATLAAFHLDVGVNGTHNAIVDDDATGVVAVDTVVNVPIDTPAVAAGQTIVASTHTASGGAATLQVMIEYTEND